MKIFVITGPSSCGKTTTVNHLAKLGYPVLHEVAREIILEGQLHPRTAAFQEELAKRHFAAETATRAQNHKIVFLDRGLYDNAAFCRHFGITQLPIALQAGMHYDAVFALESLHNFEQDGVRVESGREEAIAISNLIKEEYDKRGVQHIAVPALSVAERVDFILKHALTL